MKIRIWGASCVLVLLGTAVACSSNDSENEKATAVATAALSQGWVRDLSAATVGASFRVAPGTLLANDVIYGAVRVDIGARTQISGNGTSIIAGAGANGVYVEPDAKLPTIQAAASVSLGDRVAVSGDVVSATLDKGNGTTISGATIVADAFVGATTLSWVVKFPAVTSAHDVLLDCDETYTLAPGRYGTVRVSPRATLNLQPGVYYFEQLDLQASSASNVGTVSGQFATVHIREYANMHGVFKATSPGSMTLAYWGSNDLNIDGRVDATVVAPNGGIRLASLNGGLYRGSFYGKQVRVEAGATIEHVPAVGFATGLASGLTECQAQIPVPADAATNRDAQIKYQAELLRYCAGVTGTDCTLALKARARLDKGAAAQQFIAKSIKVDDFLGYRTNVVARLKNSLNDSVLADKLCWGADEDLDWVPDVDDKCLGTPIHTPTDAVGCSTASEHKSDDAGTHAFLDKLKMSFNPACIGAPAPSGSEGMIFLIGSEHVSRYVYASRVTNQPVGCPVFYQFELRYYDDSGKQQLLSFTRQSTDEWTDTTNMPWASQITHKEKYTAFRLTASDEGAVGAFVQGHSSKLRARVRSFNGAGATSGWSGWDVPSRMDCLRMGFDCVEI